MLIIGLGNKARHGKDWAAKTMVIEAARSGRLARIYSFADALKVVARVSFGMREKDAKLLQLLGTEIYRRMDPEVWVRTLMLTLDEQQPDIAIIPDVRFPNEADAIKAAGGYLMRVTRLAEDGSVYVAPDRDPNHPSETSLDFYGGWDIYLTVESGKLATLEEGARDALRHFIHMQEGMNNGK